MTTDREAQRRAEIDAYAQEILAGWPPVSEETCKKIATILRMDMPQERPEAPGDVTER